MTKEKIQRINELAKKSKTAELTEAEKVEQENLRNEYIEEVKADLASKLDSLVLIDENGVERKVSDMRTCSSEHQG